MTPPFLVSPLLDAPAIAHGFFSRDGGVSPAPYQSLNTGLGSDDAPENVAENRRRCAIAMGVEADHLLTGYQTHSSDVLVVDGPWKNSVAKVDGLVTKMPGVALGVLAADCMPFLFADFEAKIIGAAHAGWRGALGGILENTVASMIDLGASANNIRASVGPCLRQANFEVGLDLYETFTAKYTDAKEFFASGKNAEKRQLDLVGFGRWRLASCGVTHFDDTGLCTLGAPDRFFSYRAMKRQNERDYGRNLSVIALR